MEQIYGRVSKIEAQFLITTVILVKMISSFFVLYLSIHFLKGEQN